MVGRERDAGERCTALDMPHGLIQGSSEREAVRRPIGGLLLESSNEGGKIRGEWRTRRVGLDERRGALVLRTHAKIQVGFVL